MNKQDISTQKKQSEQAIIAKALPDLLNHFLWGNRHAANIKINEILKKTAENQGNLTNQLKKIVEQHNVIDVNLQKDIEKFGFIKTENIISLNDIILTDEVRSSVCSFIDEFYKEELLSKYNCKPRNRLLLYGPPGNGKTLIAEAVASSIKLPFLTVNYGALIDSHLGGTSGNLSQIFKYINLRPTVCFFDEFDSISVKRGNSSDVGEMRRIVNHLLMEMDRLSPNTVLVAATNMGADIDQAVSRRFDVSIKIENPTKEQILEALKKELSPEFLGEKIFDHEIKTIFDQIVYLDAKPNLKTIVDICRHIRRTLALGKELNLQLIVESYLAE